MTSQPIWMQPPNVPTVQPQVAAYPGQPVPAPQAIPQGPSPQQQAQPTPWPGYQLVQTPASGFPSGFPQVTYGTAIQPAPVAQPQQASGTPQSGPVPQPAAPAQPVPQTPQAPTTPQPVPTPAAQAPLAAVTIGTPPTTAPAGYTNDSIAAMSVESIAENFDGVMKAVPSL